MTKYYLISFIIIIYLKRNIEHIWSGNDAYCLPLDPISACDCPPDNIGTWLKAADIVWSGEAAAACVRSNAP